MCEGDWFGLGWIEGTVSWDFLLLFFHDSNSSGPLMNGLRFFIQFLISPRIFFLFTPRRGSHCRVTELDTASHRGVKLSGVHYIGESSSLVSITQQSHVANILKRLSGVHPTAASSSAVCIILRSQTSHCRVNIANILVCLSGVQMGLNREKIEVKNLVTLSL